MQSARLTNREKQMRDSGIKSEIHPVEIRAKTSPMKSENYQYAMPNGVILFSVIRDSGSYEPMKG